MTITANMILMEKTRCVEIILLIVTTIKKCTRIITSKTEIDNKCSVIKPFS